MKKAERDGTLYQTQQKEVKAVFDKIKGVLAAVSNYTRIYRTIINLWPITSRLSKSVRCTYNFANLHRGSLEE